MRSVVALFTVILSSSALAAEVSLDEAFRSAMEKNETIASARQKIEQADSVVSQVRGGILPEVTGNVNHFIQPSPSDPVAARFSPANQTSISIAVVQPVFRGLREFAVLNERRRLRDAETAALETAKRTIFLELADTYLNVLTQQQDLANVKEQLDIYERRSSLLEGRAKRGESTANEVFSAQAQQASLEADSALVESEILAAREKFHFLTGLPTDSQLKDPDAIAAGKAVVPPLESLLKRVEERPDVIEALKKHEAADENVASSWRAHSPSIDLTGEYWFVRPGFLSDLKWMVGVTATIPIFAGGTTQAAIRESVAKRAVEELGLAKARRNAVQEIRSAHAQVVARITHLKRLKRASDIAEKNAKVLERDFRRGLVRSTDVQLGLSDLNTLKRGYDKARFTAELELYRLQAATATLPALMTATTTNN